MRLAVVRSSSASKIRAVRVRLEFIVMSAKRFTSAAATLPCLCKSTVQPRRRLGNCVLQYEYIVTAHVYISNVKIANG